MNGRRTSDRVTTLWQLAWKKDRLACVIYRCAGGFELRLETGRQTLLAEPFELGPKTLARTSALKRSLQRRGWQERRR